MPDRIMLSIQATADTDSIRVASLMDVEHTVIPVVALVEGVLWPHNAPSPELALAEEFGRFPDGWNGRPVVLDHPRVGGLAVSASSPDVLEQSAVGQLFNTLVEDKKLKSEIWINMQRLEALSEDDRAQVQRLIDGKEVVEVSTGLFMMLQEEPGVYEGKEYDAVWRNIVPDHLAILPEGTIGACSIEDGCGSPRLNASTEVSNDGMLDTEEWQPVMRAAMLKTSTEKSGKCSCQTADNSTEEGVFKRVLSLFGGVFNFAGSRENAALSDVDIRNAVQKALVAAESDAEWTYIVAVFNDGGDSGTVVYELGFSGELYEREYSVSAESGVISLNDEKRAVRPITQFVPVEIVANSDNKDTGGSSEENAMNKAELVKSLVGNEATRFNEEDQEWLETLSEEFLTKLLPVENAQSDAQDDIDEKPQTEAGTDESIEVAAPISNAKTVEEFIKEAPPEIAAVLDEGVRLQASRKSKLVSNLVANSRCKFTKEQLNSKSIDELENLAILANDVTFEAANASLESDFRTQAENSDEDNFTAAPDIFKQSAA